VYNSVSLIPLIGDFSMKNMVSLVALLVSLLLVSGCGDDAADQASGNVTPTAQVAVPAVVDELPWSSLNDAQKSVLSVGETVWSMIPVEKRREMLAVADRWNQIEAADQYKMLNELRDYAGVPHIGSDTKK
jgi:hypothetical protein